ncbi:MAG TPA: hypothetical protein VEZ90_12110, partial [Blastocatellia bacterium]|nr:hypothetical protein [Blastocatellia bacterium]
MSNVCATITVQNLTGHEAAIQFSRKNATCGVDTSKIFTLKRKEVSSGTTVNFTTGTTELDYWWVGVQMLSGDFEHQYFATPGTVNSPGTEDMLASSDANKTHQIVVTSPEAGQFQATIKLASGARAASL